MPDFGALVKVNSDGTVTAVMHGLNLPTSLEFIGNAAFVVSLLTKNLDERSAAVTTR